MVSRCGQYHRPMSLQHNALPPENTTRAALFERLARPGGGVTVLTPNRRLAAWLQAEFAHHQLARGGVLWETPDILPFAAMVERAWDEALHTGAGAALPHLASPMQQQALWEEAIGAPAALLSPHAAATQCREAWGLLHAWRLGNRLEAHAGGEDARAFVEWSRRYARELRGHGLTDSAQLPDLAMELLAKGAVRPPGDVALFGFDIVTPQMSDFLRALAAAGCRLLTVASTSRQAQGVRVELPEAKDELEAAARWARARLERGARRIGVVVPDLTARRSQVQRVFATTLRPSHLVARDEALLPFDLSLGRPLAELPLVADALQILALAGPDIAFEDASRVMRSPFLAAAQTELAVRSRLDARLRQRAPARLGLDALLRLCGSDKAPRAPLLLGALERLAAFRKSNLFSPVAPSAWARAFSEALRHAGFPGERTLDSAEHQTLARWHELLAEFAMLERVTGKLGFSAALQRLVAMARDTVFQPEARAVPIEVMGVLESAGQEFDHLWVLGLTDAAWPLPARPAPFVPVSLQRAAGIPQSDAVSSLELDRRITQGWLRSAGEVVMSSARMAGESALSPSPLTAALPLVRAEDLALAKATALQEAMRGAAVMELLEDGAAPAVEAASRAGGTRLFKDQAACPFRALARHRLGSQKLETPRPGLDARDRGTLVHEMMRGVWKVIGSRERLLAMEPAALRTLLEACADEAIACVKRSRGAALQGRFGALERARLVERAAEWLDLERRRDHFEVIATEEKRALAFGGISVNVKLDRLDRIEGGLAVIDYKTGVCRTADWMGERLEEPQVPMYAASLGSEVAAVAFAVVKSGGHRFRGIARSGEPMPKVCTIDRDRNGKKRYRDWGQLAAGWRVSLEATGRAFAAGDARVDPKRGAATCENCDQHAFCRIAEKAPFGAAATEGESDE